MSLKMLMGLLASAALGALALATPAEAKGPLDGKTYVGDAGEKGKPANEKDEITFRDGKFHSKGCDAWGFGDGDYKSETKGGVTSFEAETTSAKEGTIRWHGTVKGEALEGTFVWTKTGQAPIEYWVKTTLKK